MKILFKPITALFNNLKYGQKFALIGLIILLPFAIILYQRLSELNEGIELVKKERMGVTYNMLLLDIMPDIQKHRDTAAVFLSGEVFFKDEYLAIQSHLEQDIQIIDVTDKAYGPALKTTEKWQAVKAKWAELNKSGLSLNSEENFKSHTLLIEDMLSLISHIGETSNLRFDSELDSYYLIEAVVYKLPALSEYLGQARAIGSGIAAKKRINRDEKTRLIILSGLIRSAVDANSRNFDSVFRENPELKPILEKDVKESANTINKFIETLNLKFIKAEHININAQNYFQLAANAIDSAFKTYNAAAPELDRLLQTRIAKLSKKRNLSWIIAGSAFLIITYLLMAFFITVVSSLKEITASAQRMASGDLDVNISTHSKDELGILANAFNSMALKLRESFAKQKKLYNTTQRKVQQMAILHEAVAATASHLSLESLLEKLSFFSGLLVKSELSAIVMLHPETGAIQHFKANIPADDLPLKTMPDGRGLLGAVLRGDTPIRIADASSDPRFNGLPSGHPFIKGFLGVPIILNDKVIGGIYAANKNGEGYFTEEDEGLLLMFALQAATAIENARLYAKTEELATTDGLTGLLNRRAIMEKLTEEAARSSRYKHYFSLILIDIDHFKLVNDTYGHPAGDAVLKSLAQILKKQTRTVDIVGRYGGEEFTVILPEINSAGAKLVGERIRNTVSKMLFPLPDGNKIGLTVSMGIACFPGCGNDIERLIERTDTALYLAKNAGRNRVYLYRETLIAQLENNPEQIAVLLNKDAWNIEAIITAIDVKASFFREHAEKAGQYAMLLSQGLGIREDEKDNLRLASLLHDIGFVATPSEVLRKAGNLTDEEEAVIKQHPAKGAEIIKKVKALEHLAPIIHSHHERYDGTGYPDGLKGDDIPYLARVIAVADAYASMTSSLPWRKALSKEEALKEIQAGAGSQFDPEIVKVFCRETKNLS